MLPIEISGVSKKFGDVLALQNINLSIKSGEIFGLIGPDGAGKTTLFRILTTLLLADSGTAKLGSFDVVQDMRKIREIVGYMPGRFSLYQDLSVEENLNFFATIFGTTVEANYENIKDIYEQIAPFKKRRAGKLSGGMKQKLALSCALIHDPQVLFLDEPTTGVDPVSRKEFWDMLYKLRNKGITIMVSTPYMDEASRCDRIALIQRGEILSVNTPDGIITDFHQKLWSIKGTQKFSLIEALRNAPFIRTAYAFGEAIHFIPTPNTVKETINAYLQKTGLAFTNLVEIVPNIEDCFIALMTQHTEDTTHAS